MKEIIKIFNVEYLSNNWSDFTQIWNLSFGEQSNISNEDDLPKNNFYYLGFQKREGMGEGGGVGWRNREGIFLPAVGFPA